MFSFFFYFSFSFPFSSFLAPGTNPRLALLCFSFAASIFPFYFILLDPIFVGAKQSLPQVFRLFPLPEDRDFDLIERGFNALILWARRDSGKGSGSTDLASVTWQLALNMVIKSAFTAGSIFPTTAYGIRSNT